MSHLPLAQSVRRQPSDGLDGIARPRDKAPTEALSEFTLLSVTVDGDEN
jgi:hypothetical protein